MSDVSATASEASALFAVSISGATAFGSSWDAVLLLMPQCSAQAAAAADKARMIGRLFPGVMTSGLIDGARVVRRAIISAQPSMRRLLLLAIVFAVPVPLTATRVLRLSLTDVRNRAAAILVIDVIESSARVGEAQMVWTDYRARVVEVLRGGYRGGGEITLSFAGGRAAGLDAGIAGVATLETGARYAIFLDAAVGRPMPAIGWGQGLFRITGETLVSADGEQLVVDAGGKIARRARTARAKARTRLADPLVLNADGSFATQSRQHSAASPAMALVRAAALDDLRKFVRGAIAERREETATLGGQGHSGSCTCGGFASPRVSWEIEHNDNPEYAAAAATVFDLWNRYIDVLDARTGDGTTGPNGSNEIFFATTAETSAKYGINLSDIVFAITYMNPMSAAGNFDACPKPPDPGCGTFDETDVIMNAEFFRGFRPSGPVDYSDTAPALYQGTAAHELGHALGFHHNVSNVSVMNLYEDFAAVYIATSDTEEARRVYASQARVATDLAAYPFSFDPLLTDYAATTPVELRTTLVVQDGSITLSNFGFENVGSETVSDVQLRIYFSQDAEITMADTLVGTLVFEGAVAAGVFWDDLGAGTTLAVPRDVATGTYYAGALITWGGGITDSIAYNNSFVASPQITVVPRAGRRRSVRQ